MMAAAVGACVLLPGHQVAAFAFDQLPQPAERTLRLKFQPQQPVHFTGVIRGWATPPSPVYVAVRYRAEWVCEFFQLADCLLPSGRSLTSSS
jgi:hypothetical protein